MVEAPRAGALLRRHLGDRRFLLMLPRAVGLQVLEPAIAAALTEHAPNRLWEHKKRTINQMIYMAHAERDMRPVIQHAHEHVKGLDAGGRRYHALNPEVFLFQHATYVDALMKASEIFGPAIPAGERARFYDECCAWYRGHGVSDRSLPATWEEFTEYFDAACRDRLRLDPAGAALAEQVLRPDAWIVRRVPRAAVLAMQHDRVAELLGVRVREADRLALRGFAAGVRSSFAVSPRRVRTIPQARSRRTGGYLSDVS
ncbi:oxygenase MpaB family protein [Nocardia sp. NPDC003693]